MRSENYNYVKMAYHPNGTFFHAISMLCYYKVRAKDIYKIGKRYATYKDSDAIYKNGEKYIDWLKKGIKHSFISDGMYCTHEDSIGTNDDVIEKACQDIREEILNKPKENKELFIKGILSDFSATYKLIEPIFTKPQYKIIMDILDEQQREFKLPSEEFVSWAFSSYQRFVNNLYIICLENGFNLEEIQVKYSLPISYSWDWKDADYIVSQEEFDAMCSKLKRPFKAKNGDKSIFISQLDDKELYRIHRELQDKGYIKGSVNAFISAMRDEEADFPLKWIKLSTKRKDTSLASLHNFLHLMGCKKKQAERIALIYFGEKFHRNTTYNSEYNTELQKIVKGM